MIHSPKRKKGTIMLSSRGVATKLASMRVGVWHQDPRKAAANPQNNTVTPHMGNNPKVMPKAADKASCFGSVPLRKMTRNGSTILVRHQSCSRAMGEFIRTFRKSGCLFMARNPANSVQEWSKRRNCKRRFGGVGRCGGGFGDYKVRNRTTGNDGWEVGIAKISKWGWQLVFFPDSFHAC